MNMEFNVPISGEILNEEIVNYKIEYFLASEVVELTVELTTHLGNANLYVRRCFKAECLITLDDISHAASLSSKSFFLLSESEDQDVVRFIHHPSDCAFSDSSDVGVREVLCYYVVAVYGNPQTKEGKSQYRVLAKHNETHIPLREGWNDYNYVDDGMYVYYVFQVPDAGIENVEKVKFQATSHDGELQLFASRTNQYPTISNNEKNGTHDYIEYKDGPLNGAYYISVYGQTFSSFSLLAALSRYSEKQAREIDFILLQAGIP